MPIFGLPNISKLKAKGDVERLIKIFLEEYDVELRKEAAHRFEQTNFKRELG